MLLPGANLNVDRRSGEAKLLTEPTLDETHIGSVELAAGEEHERRRAVLRLGTEKNTRLLATTHGMRLSSGQASQEGVELPSGDACLPTFCRSFDGLAQFVDVAPRQRRDVDDRGPLEGNEITLDLTVQVAAALVVRRS